VARPKRTPRIATAFEDGATYGTYVVEFRTAAGERLAISVPGTKAAVLKHFQAATAEPHAPISDGGVMTGIVKPEI
jgi:hypothetical protein